VSRLFLAILNRYGRICLWTPSAVRHLATEIILLSTSQRMAAPFHVIFIVNFLPCLLLHVAFTRRAKGRRQQNHRKKILFRKSENGG